MPIYIAIDRETIASVSSSIGFTAAKIPPAATRVVYATVQPLGGDIAFCVDGSTPSTSLGQRIVEDDVIEVWGQHDLEKFRCIDDGGTATVEVVYYGQGG